MGGTTNHRSDGALENGRYFHRHGGLCGIGFSGLSPGKGTLQTAAEEYHRGQTRRKAGNL